MPAFLKKFMVQHFGEEKAEILWQKAQGEYEQLLPLAENESKSRKKNLIQGIYPFAALYRVLLRENMTREEAMEHMFSIMKLHTLSGNRKNYERMGKLPFFFPLFRKMFTMGLSGDSWQVEWIANDPQHFVYNIQKCLWHDACTELGCPELCRIFCKNDELNFIDVSRHLYFERSQTLGEGGSCCDFRFYPKAPEKESPVMQMPGRMEQNGK